MRDILSNRISRYIVQALIIFLLFKVLPNTEMSTKDIMMLTLIIVLSYALFEQIIGANLCSLAYDKMTNNQDKLSDNTVPSKISYTKKPKEHFDSKMNCNTNSCSVEKFAGTTPETVTSTTVSQTTAPASQTTTTTTEKEITIITPATEPGTALATASPQVLVPVMATTTAEPTKSANELLLESKYENLLKSYGLQDPKLALVPAQQNISVVPVVQDTALVPVQNSQLVSVPLQNTVPVQNAQLVSVQNAVPVQNAQLVQTSQVIPVAVSDNGVAVQPAPVLSNDVSADVLDRAINKAIDKVISMKTIPVSAEVQYTNGDKVNKNCRVIDDVLDADMQYSDYNHLPLADGYKSRDFEFGYSFLPPEKWYPQQPFPPACVSDRKCPVCPIYTSGSSIDLKEWNDSRKVTPPVKINTKFVQNN